MKHLFSFVLLLALFTGCHKKDDPAPDPFLGHWQSESNTSFVLDASANATSPVLTNHNTTSLDVTATTILVKRLLSAIPVIEKTCYIWTVHLA
jgi:hypothetical protein